MISSLRTRLHASLRFCHLMLRTRSISWSRQVRRTKCPSRLLTRSFRSRTLDVCDLSLQLATVRDVFLIKDVHLTRRLIDAGATFTRSASGTYICRLHDHAFVVDRWEDLYILNEVFVTGVYRAVTPAPPTLVIDIGSNAGMAAIFLAQLYPAARVVGFEPVQPTRDRARRNLALNSNLADRITIHDYGLAGADGTHSIEYSDETPGRSGVFSHPLDGHPDTSITHVTIALKDAATILGGLLRDGVDSSVFAKIDCEGGEYEIVRRLADSGILPRLSVIVAEWHRRVSSHDPAELVQTLSDAGFTVFTVGELSAPAGMLYAARSHNGSPVGEVEKARSSAARA